MDDAVSIKAKSKTTAEYKAIFAGLIAEMERIEERMDQERAEAERLKAETQAIKAETNAKLIRLQERPDSLSKAV